MRITNYLGAACAGITLSMSAMAAPVDLSTWTADTTPGGSSSWNIQNAPANDSVLQTVNGNPTVFYEAGDMAQGRALSGNITVAANSGDDDFIGFVLGYNAGDLSSNLTDFILVDWKAQNQSPAGCSAAASRGLSISRVTDANTACDYWPHVGGVQELARANNLGDTGWVGGQTYDFELTFTSSLIEVFVDSVLEISLSASDAGIASFNNGAFGFYNYSQRLVTYGAIEEDVIPDPCLANPNAPGCNPQPPVGVPEPGSLGLLLLGGAFALMRQRRRVVG